MTPGLLRLTATLLCTALAGCAPSGSAPGPFSGAGATTAASGMTRGLSITSAESIATGANTGGLVSATTTFIVKYQANERQRRIAIQRGRAALARLERARAEPAEIEKPVVRRGGQGAEPKPKKPRVAARKKLPRYIAVDTVKSEKTSPRAARSVMIYDTQVQEIVGNNVYDVEAAPRLGETSRFETYVAEYVGTGN